MPNLRKQMGMYRGVSQEKAKQGDWVTQYTPAGRSSWRKGSSGDPYAQTAQKAAASTTAASKDYSAELRRISEAMMQAADPFRGQRKQYADQLSALYKDPSSITESASYKFRLGQGQQALERSMAAKGLLGSGNLALEVQKYGQEMASTEFDKEVNRLGTLAGAAPGSPAAGAQLGANLLGAAAGEDFNRGGYSAYAESFAGGATPQPAIGARPTTIDRNRTVSPTGGGTGIGGANFDPFSPIAQQPYVARNQTAIARGGYGTMPPQIETARAGSGITPTGTSPGGAGAYAPGTGYVSSSGGGATSFYGGKGEYDATGSILDEESGFEAELYDIDSGADFSIWGTHF